MKKLVDVVCKGYDNTLGESLEHVIKNCNMYKDEPNVIDDPSSLDVVWKKFKECPATIEDAHKLHEWINKEWLEKHALAYTSMLGFSFRPILGDLGLAIATMIMEKSENE